MYENAAEVLPSSSEYFEVPMTDAGGKTKGSVRLQINLLKVPSSSRSDNGSRVIAVFLVFSVVNEAQLPIDAGNV